MEVSLLYLLRTFFVYARQHPSRFFERVLLFILSILVIRLANRSCSCPAPSCAGSPESPSSVHAASEALDAGNNFGDLAQGTFASEGWVMPKEGPQDAFVRGGVTPAPAPTMSNDQLNQIGQMTHFEDSRGHIFRVSMGSKGKTSAGGAAGGAGAEGGAVVLNLMSTVAGAKRSGDLHNCTQFDVAFSGRARLRLFDLETGQETVKEYLGRNDFLAIPPRVPHIFEYLEDSLMLEWWDCDYRAWHYKPYRDQIMLKT